MSEQDIFSQLNPEQRLAVEHLEGPVLVVAGAGSGKTRTLVYRMARLIYAGVDPNTILLLTFTRKAAMNMLTRASELVGADSMSVAGGTFHGFAHRMLRSYAGLVGLDTGFSIMDRPDIQSLISMLIKQLDLKKNTTRLPRPASIVNIFSKAANHNLNLEEILDTYFPHLLSEYPALVRLYDEYCNYKKEHSLVDYDDLLLLFRRLLAENKEVRQAMGNKFSYIMVDEYQDTNLVQAEIVRLMAYGHDNVMVVGDDSQSIYSFRGANFKNIMDFPKLFPGTKLIKLERNYRTTQPNLDCTNAILAHAREKFSKHLRAERTGGEKPCLYKAADEIDQAKFVADCIHRYLLKGITPSEIAVLFRAGFHSFQLETELNARGIKFVKRGGLRLAESAHIKNVLSVLRLVVNPRDAMSWTRVLLLLPGIGNKSVEKLLSIILPASDPVKALLEFNGKARWKVHTNRLAHQLTEISMVDDTPLEDIIGRIISWYKPYLEEEYPADFPRRLIDLGQLQGMAGQYQSPEDFLADIALDPPESGTSDDRDRVCLSTIHSAKGLEWKVVFIISLAEGRFPGGNVLSKDEELEEERRLFYVAATRAKDDLYFCYPSFISTGSSFHLAPMSRLLKEIPSTLLRIYTKQTIKWSVGEDSKETYSSASGDTDKDLSDAEDTGAGYPIGSVVRHSIFGQGRVIQKLGDQKLRIVFDSVGERVLHLGFAKLSRLS